STKDAYYAKEIDLWEQILRNPYHTSEDEQNALIFILKKFR
ncbi:3117_t:CDS:1, partial [Scutellospora calospora]